MSSLKAKLIVLLIAMLLVTSGVIIFFRNGSASKDVTLRSEKAAEILLEKCSKISRWKECYTAEFSEFIKNNSFKEALNLLGQVQARDTKASNCHTIAHAVAFGELNKKPDEWPALARSIDIDDCGNGYIHGVLEGLLTKNKISLTTDSLSGFCRTIEDEFQGIRSDVSANCFHTLGHYLLLESRGAIEPALKSCEGFNTETETYFCYSGLFMEEFARAGLAEHAIKPKLKYNEENAQKEEMICRQLQGQQAKACWREIVTIYRFLSHDDPAGVYKYCQRSASYEFIDECYSYGIFLMVSAADFKNASLESLCDPLLERSDSYKYCVALTLVGLAFSPNNREKANSLCQSIPEQYQEHCSEVSERRFNGK